MYVAFTIHSPVNINHRLTVTTLKKKGQRERFRIPGPGITVSWGQQQTHSRGKRGESNVSTGLLTGSHML